MEREVVFGVWDVDNVHALEERLNAYAALIRQTAFDRLLPPAREHALRHCSLYGFSLHNGWTVHKPCRTWLCPFCACRRVETFLQRHSMSPTMISKVLISRVYHDASDPAGFQLKVAGLQERARTLIKNIYHSVPPERRERCAGRIGFESFKHEHNFVVHTELVLCNEATTNNSSFQAYEFSVGKAVARSYRLDRILQGLSKDAFITLNRPRRATRNSQLHQDTYSAGEEYDPV